MTYHLTGEFSGAVLIGFQLLKIIEGRELPPIKDIYPECIEGTIDIACLGIRGLISSLDLIPLKNIQV